MFPIYMKTNHLYKHLDEYASTLHSYVLETFDIFLFVRKTLTKSFYS